MTKLQKIERCVCGAEGAYSVISGRVWCIARFCWEGPPRRYREESVREWNKVMKAAKAAKKAKKGAK